MCKVLDLILKMIIYAFKTIFTFIIFIFNNDTFHPEMFQWHYPVSCTDLLQIVLYRRNQFSICCKTLTSKENFDFSEEIEVRWRQIYRQDAFVGSCITWLKMILFSATRIFSRNSNFGLMLELHSPLIVLPFSR